MKTSLQSILPAMLACGFAFAASAQDVTVPVAVETDAKAAQATDATGNKDHLADRHCLRATGSRILALQNTRADQASKHCAIGPGRVHTSADLEHTGASNLGDALRRLESSSL
jgi:hypothetical protein